MNERAKVEAERNSALMEEKVRMAQVNALAMKRDSDAQVDELDKQELLQVIASKFLFEGKVFKTTYCYYIVRRERKLF